MAPNYAPKSNVAVGGAGPACGVNSGSEPIFSGGLKLFMMIDGRAVPLPPQLIYVFSKMLYLDYELLPSMVEGMAQSGELKSFPSLQRSCGKFDNV